MGGLEDVNMPENVRNALYFLTTHPGIKLTNAAYWQKAIHDQIAAREEEPENQLKDNLEHGGFIMGGGIFAATTFFSNVEWGKILVKGVEQSLPNREKMTSKLRGEMYSAAYHQATLDNVCENLISFRADFIEVFGSSSKSFDAIIISPQLNGN